MLGRVVSHYRILSEVGAGGMGVVYRAMDTQLDRIVALKFLPANSTRDPEIKARFIQEAKAASALDHPNVCTIYEIGETGDDQLFIAMAYYKGQDLRSKLDSDPISITDAVNIAQQAASGLAEVHTQGIVHRDIKPANLFVLDSGPVKILDFGVAKLAGLSQLTRTGTTLGTVSYMSPEQSRGEEVDHRTDIWSLGVIFYEMLSGTLPFRGTHEAAVIYSIVSDEPLAPSKLNPLVPQTFDKCVLKCLQKDRELRYASATEFMADLLASEENTSIREGGRTPGNLQRFGFWALGLFILVLALVALDPLSLIRPDRNSDQGAAQQASTAATMPRLRQLSVSGTAYIPIWSPDGKAIAYTDAGGIQVCSPNGSQPRTLELKHKDAVAWNWAPDGESVLVLGLDSDRQRYMTWQVSIFGEPPRVLVADGIYADLTQDQRRVVYAKLVDQEYAGIWVRDLNTGAEHLVMETTEPGTSVYKPQWDPDQVHLAYIRWQGHGHELWYCNIDGTENRKLDIGPMHVGGHYCFSADGNWLVIAGSLNSLWSIWKVPVAGGQPVRLTDPSEYTYHVSMSPDQTGLVFSRGRDLSRIEILDLETGSLSQPFKLSVAARKPTFTGTGDAVFFQALVNGTWQVWSGSVFGSAGARPVIAVAEESCIQPQVDASGNLYHIRSDLRPNSIFGDVEWKLQLFRTSPDGGNLIQLPQVGDVVSRLMGSRRSERGILVTVTDSGNKETIQLLKTDGSVQEILRETEDFSFIGFDWGRNDNELLLSHQIADSSGTRAAVSVLDIDTGERTLLFNAMDLETQGLSAGKSFAPFGVADDRRTLVFVTTDPKTEKNVINHYDLVTGKAREVYRINEEGNSQDLAVAPDGGLVALSLYKRQNDIFVLQNLAP